MTYEYPLTWPVGLPRTKSPRRSRFDTPESVVKNDLELNIKLMGATNVVVTTNVEVSSRTGRPYANQRLEDSGAAVYFNRKGREQCIACDKWATVRDNLQAITKTIEALRGIDRWGTGEMVNAAFAGFAALTAQASAGAPPRRLWHEVLGVAPDAPMNVREAAYKALRRSTHPDAPEGSDEAFNEVTKAWGEAQL